MGKNIIIAEKPSVGMEYARMLGVLGNEKHDGYLENDKWIVTWTVGHLITMSYPEKYAAELKEWKLETIPFLPEQYKYESIKETSKQLSVVKKLYNRSDIDAIYYAGDSGREGLYIQMLVRQYAGHNPRSDEKVVWIDSQTEEEILRGVAEAKPLADYEAMSASGYMRAIEDYAVGINFSRLLSIRYAVMVNSGSAQKKHKPISVGRVMTCVLGMIVKREREIKFFKPTNFYRIAGKITVDGKEIECEWRVSEKSKYYQSPKLYSEYGFLKEADAQGLMDGLDPEILITDVVKTQEKKNAPLLFNLAELQGECAKLFHYSPAETLQIAQRLYEKKLTTYPRTDARVLTNAIAKEISKNLNGLMNGNYGMYAKRILDNKWAIKSKYIDDSKVTDHYAVIPTGVHPEKLDDQEKQVYDVICRRFLAVFYPAAEYTKVAFDGYSGNELFHGTSKFLVTPGYYEVVGNPTETADAASSALAMESLKKANKYAINYEIKKGETKPPKRYSSGTIILAMEGAGTLIEDDELREQIKSNGIGTSATRAEVIEKLQRLNYIAYKDKNQTLIPTNFGEMVYEVVNETIPEMLSPEMTARWEQGLEKIALGEITKQSYQEQLYTYIKKTCDKLKAADNTADIAKKIRNFASNRIQYEYKEFDPYNTQIKCPICGDDVETTNWGFRCKSAINREEGCQFTIGDILGHRLLTNELASMLHYGKTGPFCDFVSQKGKPFAAYLKWNKGAQKLEIELTDMPWDETKMKCPICGKKILSRDGFYRCENYIDRDHGCGFYIGKILGKSIPQKQIEKLIESNETDLITGFKKKDGSKFDAFLVWDRSGKCIKFRFPDKEDLLTKYSCPICGGKIMATSNGYKCEHFKMGENRKDGDCSFYLGKILGHTIKEKELEVIVSGGTTELISLKNKDDKKFEARLFWNKSEQRIGMRFDDNQPIETKYKCPICGNSIMKNKFGYFCQKYSKNSEGCKFYIGSICGILVDDTQIQKLVTEKKTDLISGFKPKERGKQPFSAYLVWDEDTNNIRLEFPDRSEMKEQSNFTCPSCNHEKLYLSKYGYSCNCGFRVSKTIAEKEISDDQFKKLFITGSTDYISGFFSRRTRKMFRAKLVIRDGKIEMEFPEIEPKEGDKKNEG